MSQLRIWTILIVSFVLLGSGCANPADDATEAVVKEAAPKPITETIGTTFVISDESTLGFVGSKVTGSHEGGFNAFGGEIVVPDGDFEQSSVTVNIDTTSLWADDPKLTEHLKSGDFFGVADFPSASFTSTGIVRSEEGYTVTGNLDLHGVTKSVSFPANISIADGRVNAQAEFFVKRFDFGIVYPGKADDLIRDEVVIKLDLVAVPADESSATEAS